MKFDFRAALAGRGVVDCPRFGCLADDRLLYRLGAEPDGSVQVAVRKDFDRWANSVDFVFSVPRTRSAFDRLMERLDAAVRAKRNPMEIGRCLRL